MPRARASLRRVPVGRAVSVRGRRYEPLRKQSPFEGSFRQRRAHALRAVLAGGSSDDAEAIAALARDGLVRVEGESVTVPA